MTIEIVDLSIKKWWFSIAMLVCHRVGRTVEYHPYGDLCTVVLFYIVVCHRDVRRVCWAIVAKPGYQWSQVKGVVFPGVLYCISRVSNIGNIDIYMILHRVYNWSCRHLQRSCKKKQPQMATNINRICRICHDLSNYRHCWKGFPIDRFVDRERKTLHRLPRQGKHSRHHKCLAGDLGWNAWYLWEKM